MVGFRLRRVLLHEKMNFKAKWLLPLAAVSMALALIWFREAWTGWWGSRQTVETPPVAQATSPQATTAPVLSEESALPGLPEGLHVPLRPRGAAQVLPRPKPPVTNPPPAAVSAAAREFERASALTVELENQLVVQVQHYLLEHDQAVPASLDALMAATSPNVDDAKLAQALIHFEFIVPPEGTAKASDGLHLFRERKARLREDGEWVRNYVTAAGGSRVATLPDGNFEAWERRWIPSASPDEEARPVAQPGDSPP